VREALLTVTNRWEENTVLMRRQTRSLVLFGWIFAGLLWSACVMLQAQAKNDIDASDRAAFQQKLEASHEFTFKLQNSNPIGKACQKGHSNEYSTPRKACSGIADNPYYGQEKESILLKGCSFPNMGEGGGNPCLQLASLYEQQGRYLEALAVYQSPNIKDGLDDFDYGQILNNVPEIYRALGNANAERATLSALCSNYGFYIACLNLRQLGVQVDLAAASDRADKISEQDDRLRAQSRADQQEAANEKRQHSQATINAVYSAVGVPSSPSYGSVQGNSGASSPAATSQSNSSSSCNWMTNSVSITPLHFEVGQGGNYCTQDKNDAQWEIHNNAGTGVYCRFRNMNNGTFVEGQIYVASGAGQTIDNPCARDGQIQYVCYSSDQSANDTCVHGSVAWR
jgi:hypothetical protein